MSPFSEWSEISTSRCPDSGTKLLRVGPDSRFKLIGGLTAQKARVSKYVPDSTDLDRTASNS